MRSYSVRVVAIALDAPVKWVDNALSHHLVPGVTRRAKGVERRLDSVGLLVLSLARSLAVDLGVPLALGTRIASQVARDVADGDTVHRHSLTSGLVLEVPVAAIARRTRERLEDAAEAVAHIRRGRPAAHFDESG